MPKETETTLLVNWYLSEEAFATSFFDVSISLENKRKMIQALGEQGGEYPAKQFV